MEDESDAVKRLKAEYDNKEFKDPNYIEKWKLERQTGAGTAPPASGTDSGTSTLNLYTGWIYLFRGKGEY